MKRSPENGSTQQRFSPGKMPATTKQDTSTVDAMQRALNLLFIEDTLDDAELAVRNLAKEGLLLNWERVDNEQDLRAILAKADWQPDIILSDYSMPGFSGHAALQVCQELVPDIPFIFLSGTIGEELAIESIHNGATDYVLKENMRRLSTSVNRAVNDSIRRRRTQEVEKERSRLVTILEATSDFVLVARPDGVLFYLNKSARNLLPHRQHDDGLRMESLCPEEEWRLVREELQSGDGGAGVWQGDSWFLAPDGTRIPVSMVVIAHHADTGEVEYFSVMARDIRDRRAYESKIQYLANYDALSALPNRTLLADRVAQAINYSLWTNRPLAVLMVDIDRFKLINDGYGREFGDELLRHFSERLRGIVRDRDTVARISADCFAVLATELSSPEDVIVLVGKLQEQLSGYFVVNGHTLALSVGIGISVYPRDGQDFTTLLQNADAAMHRLKENGESGFQFYAVEMTQHASEKVRLEAELRQALPGSQLELHYQTQVVLNDGTITGIEALMRWHHPTRGMVPPGVFIPVAENSDLICAMGEWALYSACRQLQDWDAITGLRPRIAVNVSVRQFRSKGFVEVVERVLKSLQLEPSRLELELTESVLVQDHLQAAAILNQLQELGVQIALDDFGTGYSNLSYLSRLPIHCLKIDQSFVRRSSLDSSDVEIIRAIISLADSLGLRVVAEGIETQQQLELLRRYNCGEGQGYYFSRPQPAAVLTQMLGTGGTD